MPPSGYHPDVVAVAGSVVLLVAAIVELGEGTAILKRIVVVLLLFEPLVHHVHHLLLLEMYQSLHQED